ncbi:TIGR02301 family protein [Chelativorans salis]|uniref:TIGR02301 family protein n=1 Tax=Chelativorans salis TaxID=2978478 RepID=A0ABT2LQR4_9HYPH|nr:TIGR02301 family protein [Chelativorans sp. EGI FJ00035]MCT7375973.1 TIGR02301 family protein [Chelativorans sp. EGI FJ00035]
MRSSSKPLAAAALFLASVFAAPAAAVDAPYDRQLMRLSEVLGSIHYLRRLCGEEDGGWRAQMEALLRAEAPSEERRAKLVASFNHGYRSFAAIYSTCTESAVQAIERYMSEGEALTSEIVLRYGN